MANGEPPVDDRSNVQGRETMEPMSEKTMNEDGIDKSKNNNGNNSKYQTPPPPPPEGMSKRAWKRELRRKQIDSMKETFAEKRREKRKEKRAEAKRKREEGEDEIQTSEPNDQNKRRKTDQTQERANINVVIDCGFDEKMKDRERTSLAIQLNRSYSENRKAAKAVNLYVSSFNKKLRERFEGPMHSQHLQWKSKWMKFCVDDFVRGEVGDEDETRQGEQVSQDEIKSVSQKETKQDETEQEETKQDEQESQDETRKTKRNKTVENTPQGCPDFGGIKNLVYLSSDSSQTLERLEEGKTYIIGGIVDKGRYKNLCKEKAEKHGIATAKLPIDEFIKVSGRRVLTTNHVFEILLQWLDSKDWKEAFEKVLPARKFAEGDMESETRGSLTEVSEVEGDESGEPATESSR